jgi:outer membrane protein insertion porin family
MVSENTAAGQASLTALESGLAAILSNTVSFHSPLIIAAIVLVLCATTITQAQVGDYEGRTIASVDLVFEGSPADPLTQAELQSRLSIIPNTEYSAVRTRQSLKTLFDSDRVESARVEITELQPGAGKASPISVRFIVKREVVISEVKLVVGPTTETPISTDELRARLNLLEPGRRYSEQAVARNADEIQTYLRDRGYFNATVEWSKEPTDASGIHMTVTYTITPGPQSHVAAFDIKVAGFDDKVVRPSLKLQQGAPFTRDVLGEDVNRIRQAIMAQGYLAPSLEDPRVELNPDQNVLITLEGKIGPKVEITFKNYALSEKKQRELLPIKREGNIDYSVIQEGSRRVRYQLQEQGYFFATVESACTVTPDTPNTVDNGTDATCQNLNSDELDGHTVNITYSVDLGRRFKLTEIRITGTNKLTYTDIADALKTRRATALGFIPLLGFGRGFTSNALLEEDKRTIRALMRDLGYRRSEVAVKLGASISGENLIITFDVKEGALTRVAEIAIDGEQAFPEDRLRKEIHTITEAPYSRSLVRADTDRLLNLYAREGYIAAKVDASVDELPRKGDDEQVRVIYHITNEGAKAIVNRIIVNGVTGDAGTQSTKRAAIMRAIPLAEGDILRADRITDAERALYVTDAFRQVIIHQVEAGDGPAGTTKYDLIIDVEEKKPRVIEYGGGYSSGIGPFGLVELTNVNLMNRLRTGAIRLRASPRRQLLRLEYLDPRFIRYREKEFAPLAVSIQYLRDSTITRFFRSTIDRGTFGIVQRLDQNGNPIDEFGRPAGEPEINRFTFNIETQRVLSQARHSIVFLRYSYEDVRLRNIDSLLLKDVLLPDQVVRISRFGTSFVYDTRQRCERSLPGSVPGEEDVTHAGETCRFNQLDATRGQFLSADYSFAMRALGGNTSFMRFQSTYHRYQKVQAMRNTVLAGSLTMGLARVFNIRDRNGNGRIDDVDRLLPISERFFAGGGETLRGFSFQEAGPRLAILPEGQFRNSRGQLIFLNPFTVPVGGNAMVIANLEARVPVTNELQVVPFVDAGNVFRRVSDIFGHPKPTPPTGNFLDDINAENLRAHWTSTIGMGVRIKTPFGGALAIDYGFLVNPPKFLIPQLDSSGNFIGAAVYRPNRGRIHFRFSQTF